MFVLGGCSFGVIRWEAFVMYGDIRMEVLTPNGKIKRDGGV